jgi:aminoglycoside phosphotransferase family enzyme/predicted kinase
MPDSIPNDPALAASRELVQNLARSHAFPHSVTTVGILETHISWVILTGPYAYKIKKPLDLGFLDFSTIELRHHFCVEELRLNRRFAPQIYLDVVTIGGTRQQPAIGAEPALDWAVKMRQFPGDARLDDRLSRGLVTIEDMLALGRTIAELHSRSPMAGPDGEFGSVAAIREPAMDNFRALEHCFTDEPIAASLRERLAILSNWTQQQLQHLEPLLRRRRQDGLIRECHGDLHLANLVRVENKILAFDCLEFDARLRWIDVMSEVGFLVMDTIRNDRSDLAYAFLNGYLEVSGDYAGIEVLPFYLVYRSLVRAKVAALLQKQNPAPGGVAAILRYIDLAENITTPAERPILIITHGVSGSGKTFLSQRLMCDLPAVRLRSDIQRKHLHGYADLQKSHSRVNSDLYSSDATALTYANLRDLAALILHSGFHVIVDAANLGIAQRRVFFELATVARCGFLILDCVAQQSVLSDRVARRTASGTDASEADLRVLRHQLARYEPLSSSEKPHALRVDTGTDIDPVKIAAEIRQRASTR